MYNPVIHNLIICILYVHHQNLIFCHHLSPFFFSTCPTLLLSGNHHTIICAYEVLFCFVLFCLLNLFIYVPKIGTSKCRKKILMDVTGDINNNTVIVRDVNTPFTSMDMSSRQKVNKEIVTINNPLDQMVLIDIFRARYPKAAQHTFFSSEHGIFSKRDYVL